MATCGPGKRRQNDQAPADEGSARPFLPSERLLPESTGHHNRTDSGILTSKVTLKVSESSYKKGERIVARVANGLQYSIYTEDMKTDCSIVTLEHWAGSRWQPLLNCGMERLTSIVRIEAGQAVRVEIQMASSNVGANPGGQKVPLGMNKYRLKFTYRFSPGPEGFEPEVVYSDVFSITS
jgi:hypothetical protein